MFVVEAAAGLETFERIFVEFLVVVCATRPHVIRTDVTATRREFVVAGGFVVAAETCSGYSTALLSIDICQRRINTIVLLHFIAAVASAAETARCRFFVLTVSAVTSVTAVTAVVAAAEPSTQIGFLVEVDVVVSVHFARLAFLRRDVTAALFRWRHFIEALEVVVFGVGIEAAVAILQTFLLCDSGESTLDSPFDVDITASSRWSFTIRVLDLLAGNNGDETTRQRASQHDSPIHVLSVYYVLTQ